MRGEMSKEEVLIDTLRKMGRNSGCHDSYAYVAGYLAGLACDAASTNKDVAQRAAERIRQLAAGFPEGGLRSGVAA